MGNEHFSWITMKKRITFITCWLSAYFRLNRRYHISSLARWTGCQVARSWKEWRSIHPYKIIKVYKQRLTQVRRCCHQIWWAQQRSTHGSTIIRVDNGSPSCSEIHNVWVLYRRIICFSERFMVVMVCQYDNKFTFVVFAYQIKFSHWWKEDSCYQ